MKRAFLFFLAPFLLFSACSKNQSPPAESPKKEVAANPIGAATISGEILFEGTVPEEKKNPAASIPECVKENTENNNRKAIVNQGKLKNVFVYLKNGVSGTFPPPSSPVIFDQHYCSYLPRVLGLQVGQPLEIRNSDPFLHNVHSKAKSSSNFNIGMPFKGMKQTKTFDHTEIMVNMKCDVHGWMAAYIGVLPHPFFAVSDEKGLFSVPNVPAGNYVVEAWHELLGTQTAPLAVEAAKPAALKFTFKK